MNVKCTQCGATFFVMNTLAGKKIQCAHCHTVMVAPAAPLSAAKPMFKPGALKLPPKPQLKAGLKLASGTTSAPALAPVAAPPPVPVVEPPPAPVVEPPPAPAPVVEPPPAPAPVVEPPPAPVAEGEPTNDLVARLTKLKSLYDMGLISEEELHAQRTRILAEI